MHVIHPRAHETPTPEPAAQDQLDPPSYRVVLPDDVVRLLNEARLQVDRAVRTVLLQQEQLAEKDEQIRTLQLQIVDIQTTEEQRMLHQSTDVLAGVLDRLDTEQQPRAD